MQNNEGLQYESTKMNHNAKGDINHISEAHMAYDPISTCIKYVKDGCESIFIQQKKNMPTIRIWTKKARVWHLIHESIHKN